MRKRLFRVGKSHSGGSFAAPEDHRGALGGEAVILEVFGGQKGGSVETAKLAFSIVFYRGPCKWRKKQNSTKNKKTLKMCFVLQY